MQVQDDLYTGPVGPAGFILQSTVVANPARQGGLGPLGRILFRNILPLASAPDNVCPLQAPTAGTYLTFAAGTSTTLGDAPDLCGDPCILLDVPRCISLTSTADLSGVNFMITCFDEYSQKWTQLLQGPNNGTVYTKKSAKSVYEITPDATSASLVSVGTSNIFGLQVRVIDAGYVVSAKWDNTLAPNAGTFTPADLTDPATSLTGDTRGTFAPAGNAPNGARRLVIALHVDAGQCGSAASLVNAVGVQQA
jgi:hypothetical protein